MRLTCKYTGQVFTFAGFDSAKTIQSHPLCNMQMHELNKLAAKQLSSEEEKLLLIAFLSKLPTIEWDIPCALASITSVQVASYLPRALRLANWLDRATDEQLASLPYYRVCAETAKLESLGAYLVALEGWKEYGRYIPDTKGGSKTAVWESHDKMQAARRAMLMRQSASKEATDRTIPWAIQCLTLSNPDFTAHTAKLVRECLTGKYKNMPSVLKEVREMLLVFLPEQDIQDDIRKTALISRLDEMLLKQLHFLQELGLNISAEQELLDDIQASYTIAGSEKLSADGQPLLNSAASPVKFLRQIQKQPLTGSALGMWAGDTSEKELPPAPTSEPKREDYSNALLYAVAKKRWTESQTAATSAGAK